MLSSSTSRFDSMPAQPPTPPREISKAVDDAIHFLDDSHEIERALRKQPAGRRRSVQSSSVLSPAASQESSTTVATAKKVDFSPHPVYHGTSRAQRPQLARTGSTCSSLSSKDAKPLKSILKLSTAPPLTPSDLELKLSYFSPTVPGSFFKMLRSVLQQLASDSIPKRLDAYLALNGALQAYSDVPDPAALTQNIGLITQYLSRDLAWKDGNGKPDTNIVTQALKLTTALMFNNTISAAFDNDFKNFIVDRSVAVIEQGEMPKQIVKIHLHLIAQQKFSTSVMTSAKADRIVTALQTIEDRCSGNSVIATRLVVYQRLLEQNPALMLTRIRDWLEKTFHCMLSSNVDIRGRAIETCNRGALRLGQQSNAARTVCDLLDTEVDAGQEYFDYLKLRLVAMSADKESGPCVPQIWSAINLFFRSSRLPLVKWKKFKSWLGVIQKCLNSSDIRTRYQASLAWNQLSFITLSDSLPPGPVMNMLTTPISNGIDRRGKDQNGKQVRQYSMDSYHNLLHYGLRPGLEPEELNITWDVFVDPIISKLAGGDSKSRIHACRILHGLLTPSNGTWNPNAALLLTPVKADELPRLDSRWTRSRIGKVLKLLAPLARSWRSDSEESKTFDQLWEALMHTVAEAGTQEVKTSNDLKGAIAVLVNFFRQFWSSSLTSDFTSMSECCSRHEILVDKLIAVIGPAHFLEDILTTNEDDGIEVAPTPSMKRSKHHSAPQAPITILLRPLWNVGTEPSAKKQASASATVLLQRCTATKPSTTAKLELLRRVLHASPTRSHFVQEPSSHAALWETIAGLATTVLTAGVTLEPPEQGSLGPTLRSALDILDVGITTVRDAGAMSALISLYDSMYAAAKSNAGDGGVVLAVIEPVSKALVAAGASVPLGMRLHFASHIVTHAVWPWNHQSLDAARKALWGAGLPPHKVSFDPFEHVYSLVADVMTSMYTQLESLAIQDLQIDRDLFAGTTSFMGKAPAPLLLACLRRLQHGFATWVEDKARKTANDSDIAESIRITWSAILKLMKAVPSSDSNVLVAIEALLIAGLVSPHRDVVNETIVFWNSTFGSKESLEYPAALESVLRARSTDTEIELPTFPQSNNDTVPATIPNFFESESQISLDGRSDGVTTKMVSGNKEFSRQLLVAQTPYYTGQKSPAQKVDSNSSPARRRLPASGSSTPKARLRHDDSQIQFAHIESSPLRLAEESQHLTDHQKEVQARQHDDAQMFPDLSSSPMVHSTALPRSLPKKLNFKSNAQGVEDGEDTGTPTGPPHPNTLMSDDITSSPTPSSTKKSSQNAIDYVDGDTTEDEADDLPSSPPHIKDKVVSPKVPGRLRDVGPDDTTVDATDFANTSYDDRTESSTPERANAGGDQDEQQEPHAMNLADNDVQDDGPVVEPPSELHSDSVLPTEQLQAEAQAAEIAAQAPSTDTSIKPPLDSQDDSQEAQLTPGNVTRVEDSFKDTKGDDAGDDDTSQFSHGNQPGSRKRKRKTVTYSARKKASPFRRFVSSIWGGSQQQDEDIGDEIVVASSQQSKSQSESRSPPEPTDDPPSEPVGEPVKAEAMAPPPKRGPGRPRKSQTPTPTPNQNQSQEGTVRKTRALKRRASGASDVSAVEPDLPTSSINDTPAPAKVRKTRHSQTATSPSSQEQVPTKTRATRRAVSAVVVSRPSLETTTNVEDAAENIEVATPQKQTSQTKSPVSAQRPMNTPRSIIGRLRDALGDLVGMKVSRTEAREFDDVLFELRREVHEADSRGRTG